MDFEEIKNKVLSALGQAADSAKDLAGKAADGAKDLAGKAADKAKAGTRIAKLSMDLASAKEAQKKTYLEIGREYYSQHKDAPEDFFTQLFAEVAAADKKIEEISTEIAELKASMSAPGVEVEVEVEPDDGSGKDVEAEEEDKDKDDGGIEIEITIEKTPKPEEEAPAEAPAETPVEAPAEAPAEPEAPVDAE